jgi:hypothetical protein
MTAHWVLLAALADPQVEPQPLRFAWPAPAEARVEVEDERAVGTQKRTVVISMRLRVEPAGENLMIRLSDAQLRSINGVIVGAADPAETMLATGRVLKATTPSIVVGRDGRFLALADGDKLVAEVLASAGFPSTPPAIAAFTTVLRDFAKEDWAGWVGAWIGSAPMLADAQGHVRLEASTIRPAESVREATRGFLVDMAREAQELGDDPAASARFLERATYGPMTVTTRVELDPSTMRPYEAERVRTFYAVNGKHRVDGRERRTHRFVWQP